MPEPRPAGRRARPPALLVGLAALVALLLAGCASMPTGGQVRVHEAEADPDRAGVRAVAPEPPRGESPAGIVGNFLLAVTGDDLAVARSYLTEQAAATWRPTERTVVYDGELDLQGLPQGGPVPGEAGRPAGDAVHVTATVSVVAEVDAAGHYRAAAPGTAEQVALTLRRDAELQWRIAALDDLLLLNEASFERLVRQVPLYFPDPTGRYLVPDVRWYPQRASLPTTVASALLDGPAEWLRSAVGTVTPDGTALSNDAVTVSGGVAQVELTDQVLASSGEQRSVLQAQMEATLLPLPGVSAVELRVAGTELAQTAPSTVLERDPPAQGPLVALAGDVVVELGGGTAVPVPDVPSADGYDPTRLAAAFQPGTFAVVTEDGTRLRLLRAGEPLPSEPLLVGQALSAPSFDRYGFVWTADTGGTVSAVRATSPADGPAEAALGLDADWLAGRDVVALRISRDGSRAAVASRDGDGPVRVEVAGVARDRDGTPSRLDVAPGGSLLPGAGGVADVTWVGDSALAVLGRAPGGGSTVILVTVIGPRDALGSPDATATSVTAGRVPQTLHLGTADGRLLARAGAGWTEALPSGSVRWPTFPG